MQVYESSPAKYKKVFCENHSTEVLTKACKKCDRLLCAHCDVSDEYCTGEGKYISRHYLLLKLVDDGLTIISIYIRTLG